jgi:superfamily II DNA or RNA helicase
MFGVSASHDKRLDKADFELEGVFGPIRMKVTDDESRKHNIVVQNNIFWHSVFCPDPCEGLTGTDKMKAGIWRNKARNKIIADIVKSYDKDEQILIMVQTLDHAINILKLLPDFTLCYSPTAKNNRRAKKAYKEVGGTFRSIDHNYAQELKEKFAKQEIKKVIATGVWSRGVDFRPLEVLIRADASASPIRDDQIPGRTSRTSSETGKKAGEVHDFKDQFNKGFEERAKGRKRNYAAHGWNQQDVGKSKKSGRSKNW